MYKPRGCLVTRYDAQGRSTIFDLLPSNLSNVRNIIAIGRLDYNSEGLLLLTNDGHFARKMSLPATNIQRVYNCRISRNIRDDEIESLSKGMTISSGSYRPIYAKRLDRDNGTFRIDDGALRERVNQWIQLRLNEGKNREIRNVLKAFGIEVSRLIRISYGPFRLDGLRQGDIIEDSAWRGNSKLRL